MRLQWLQQKNKKNKNQNKIKEDRRNQKQRILHPINFAFEAKVRMMKENPSKDAILNHFQIKTSPLKR